MEVEWTVPGRAHQEISPRRACILAAIVEEYVETAAPVGSKAVRERRALDVSTATIRNEMGVLERAGYIRQPHTSAGRIPSTRARAYVDAIEAPDSPRETAAGCDQYRHLARRDPEIRTTRVCCRSTAAPAMVMLLRRGTTGGSEAEPRELAQPLSSDRRAGASRLLSRLGGTGRTAERLVRLWSRYCGRVLVR